VRAADVKAATSTSQTVIASGAGGGVAFLVLQRHPEDDSAPLIDYSLAAVLTPPILFGVSTGAMGGGLRVTSTNPCLPLHSYEPFQACF